MIPQYYLTVVFFALLSFKMMHYPAMRQNKMMIPTMQVHSLSFTDKWQDKANLTKVYTYYSHANL